MPTSPERIAKIAALIRESRGKHCPADFKSVCRELEDYREKEIPFLLSEVESLTAELAGHKAMLAAFDDGAELSSDVISMLKDETELRAWVKRCAWHCKKVHEQHTEISQLRARLSSLRIEAGAAREEICRKCLRVPCDEKCEWFDQQVEEAGAE